MYVLDTNVFISLGHYYPKRFPTLWDHINDLADNDKLISVREVRREIENHCQWPHILDWVDKYRHIFLIPANDECLIVNKIFENPQYTGFIKRTNILKGLPVADPFIIASAKVKGFTVVTQESYKANGARIPTACEDFDVGCIDLEEFLEREGLEF